MLKTNIFQLLQFCGRFGLKALWNNYYYTRHIEYPLCFNKLELNKGMRILDVGSGNSIYPVYMAYRGCIVQALDFDDFVFKLKDISKKMWFRQLIDTGQLKIDVQDSRKLSYPNDSFDRVCAVSTLEHIPDNGDISSMKEINRVLKKGGRAFISLEANAKPREFYVKHKFYYGHPYLSEYIKSSIYFQDQFAGDYEEFRRNNLLYSLGFIRYYDNKTILERIIDSSGLALEEMGYYANTNISYRMFFDKSRFARFVSILTPLIAGFTFQKLDSEEELPNLKPFPAYFSNAIAYIVLKKAI